MDPQEGATVRGKVRYALGFEVENSCSKYIYIIDSFNITTFMLLPSAVEFIVSWVENHRPRQQTVPNH